MEIIIHTHDHQMQKKKNPATGNQSTWHWTRSNALLCNCWKFICIEFLKVNSAPVNTVLRWPSRRRMTRQAAPYTAQGIGAQGGWRDRRPRRRHRMTGWVYLWQWRLLLHLSEDWSQSGKLNTFQKVQTKGLISLAETSPRLPWRLISRGDSSDSGDQK